MKKYIISAIVVSLVGFVIYNKVYIPKHTYNTVSVSSGDMAIKVNGVGEVSSKEVYKIGSIYGGKVMDFTVEEGDQIQKDTLIAKVDSVDLKDKINELKATIEKLKNDTISLDIDRKSAEESYLYQKDILKKNQNLYKKNVISELDFKKFQTNAITSKLKASSIKAKIDSLHNQKIQLEASVSGLKERLSRYTITAPVTGYITKKYISNFAIINPNQTIVDIIDTKDVWVATHIDTRMSGDIKIGDKATIVLRSSSKKYKATVVNIKPINNNITYEREVDVAFDNLPIPFYLEEQAIVNIDIKVLHNIIKVPSNALTIYKEKQGVWIVENHIVKFKTLNILAYGDKNIATRDIAKNVKLVIPSPTKKSLTNGMKIYND